MDTAKHILIVEDDRDILDVLKDLLESEGYRVSTSENGKEAISFLNSATPLPDLILVDLMMPIMNGFQFREAQQNDERLKSIPVILMSADGHVESKKEKIGMQLFMKKPLDLEQVLSTIATQSKRSA